MAVIHTGATVTPSKLELLAPWLVGRPWYAGSGTTADLVKAGGFRLDDPAGEVGIEFMVVTDRSTAPPVSYHVPLTYRDAPLAGADDALIGITEHGVLGTRWVYDAAHDPVCVAQLIALIQGEAEPQAQGVSDTPDHSVLPSFTGRGAPTVTGSSVVGDDPAGTELAVQAGSQSADPRSLTLRIVRVLTPGEQAPDGDESGARGHVTAEWKTGSGEVSRGVFATFTAIEA